MNEKETSLGVIQRCRTRDARPQEGHGPDGRAQGPQGSVCRLRRGCGGEERKSTEGGGVMVSGGVVSITHGEQENEGGQGSTHLCVCVCVCVCVCL